MNGKNIIRHPCHLRLVAADQPFEFVGYRRGASAPMRFSEDLVAAPAAMIRTPARGDERKGTHAVVLAPPFDITPHSNRFPSGPRLSFDVLYLLSWLRPDD